MWGMSGGALSKWGGASNLIDRLLHNGATQTEGQFIQRRHPRVVEQVNGTAEAWRERIPHGNVAPVCRQVGQEFNHAALHIRQSRHVHPKCCRALPDVGGNRVHQVGNVR